MKVQKATRLGLLVLLLASIVVGLAMSASVWAEGFEQSPINIRARDVTYVSQLPVLNFTYSSNTTLNVVNTGSPNEESTVRANVPSGAGTLQVEGVTYNLLQFHWHTPSEHLIEGRSFPLEMHLVHQAADGRLLVVGVFIRPGTQPSELSKIFTRLPQQSGSSTTVTNFDLRRLLPRYRQSFRYIGSLTTPPFTEGVRWVVLAQPIELSWNEIRAFRNLFPEGNAREVQPLNGRKVLTDVRLCPTYCQ